MVVCTCRLQAALRPQKRHHPPVRRRVLRRRRVHGMVEASQRIHHQEDVEGKQVRSSFLLDHYLTIIFLQSISIYFLQCLYAEFCQLFRRGECDQRPEGGSSGRSGNSALQTREYKPRLENILIQAAQAGQSPAFRCLFFCFAKDCPGYGPEKVQTSPRCDVYLHARDVSLRCTSSCPRCIPEMYIFMPEMHPRDVHLHARDVSPRCASSCRRCIPEMYPRNVHLHTRDVSPRCTSSCRRCIP